ncbi:hypothetical protein [Neisseria lactamica]|uniref:hypothetical protein n=1 Tax=Neisseria lactamica TaxID=486 RepID=UPI000E1DAA87|nr:hypothetical protein [Neisseria lactamica]
MPSEVESPAKAAVQSPSRFPARDSGFRNRGFRCRKPGIRHIRRPGQGGPSQARPQTDKESR